VGPPLLPWLAFAALRPRGLERSAFGMKRWSPWAAAWGCPSQFCGPLAPLQTARCGRPAVRELPSGATPRAASRRDRRSTEWFRGGLVNLVCLFSAGIASSRLFSAPRGATIAASVQESSGIVPPQRCACDRHLVLQRASAIDA